MKDATCKPLHGASIAPIFEGIDPQATNAIIQEGHLCSYNAGDQIVCQGFIATEIFLVEDGLCALLHTTQEGDQLLLDWLRPGDPCGLASLVINSPTSPLTATACSHTLALRWSGVRFRVLLREHPRLLHNVMTRFHNLFVATLARLELFRSTTIEQRVAALLIEAAEQLGTKVPQGTELRLLEEQLAQMAGTSIFSISRLIGRWERAGMLIKTRGRIIIPKHTNVVTLTTAAADSPELTGTGGQA